MNRMTIAAAAVILGTCPSMHPQAAHTAQDPGRCAIPLQRAPVHSYPGPDDMPPSSNAAPNMPNIVPISSCGKEAKKAPWLARADRASSPVAVFKVEPEYSAEARRAQFQGTVALSMLIDKTGRPKEVRVIRPLGLGLDEKAVEAAQKWRFRPAYRNRKPVASRTVIEMNFRLRWSPPMLHTPADTARSGPSTP